MKKTVRQQLEDFNTIWSGLAIEHIAECNPQLLDDTCCVSQAIALGFDWSEKDKGYQYWMDIFEDLRSKRL